MKNKEFFYKRFSVGLTLDTNLELFEQFLSKYHTYIANFYFSLPMGDKFHSRINVRRQLRDPEKVKLFWKMLSLIKSFDIKLELVLNNGNVTEAEAYKAKALLSEHDIEIDLVGITNDIFEIVQRVFPTKEVVYSFNNRTNSRDEFEHIPFHYDEIVLGRQNIRNVELFDRIHNGMKSKVVLLLNNGCSHLCGGCTTLANCHSAYYRAKLNCPSEYLYALQSIMPYEIHDGLLDVACVDLFKINSRNASIQQLNDCMDSYINCIEDEYIEQSRANYMLWGRLAWHVEFFDEFSLQRIREYKSLIYSKTGISRSKNKIKLCLDLRDKYLFEHCGFTYDEKYIKSVIDKESRGLPYSLDECIIGVSNCRNMFANISLEAFRVLLQKLKLIFNKISFEIPPLIPENYVILDELLKCASDSQINCIVVNDWDTVQYISNNYSLAIAVGEALSFSNIYSPSNDYDCDNNEYFGANLVNEELRQKISEICNVKFVVCDMDPKGLCISKNEVLPLYVNLQHRSIAYATCNCNEESACNMPCLHLQNAACKHIGTDQPWNLHYNSIREYITDYSPIVKTVLENRATFIIKV